jgi:hypothetical protein
VLFAARVQGGCCSFVLDGHHKLQAYRESDLPPAVLYIEKRTPDPIPWLEGVRLLGAARGYAMEYVRLKREYGRVVTEADWLAATKPWILRHYMHHRASDRKHRLFVCACCRRLWQRLGRRSREALEVSERFAEGQASEAELDAAHRSASAAPRLSTPAHRAVVYACQRPAVYDAASSAGELSVQLLLARDVFGNPFRRVEIAPEWLTWNGGTVRTLAQGVYEERSLPEGTLDSARLAILADALEEAGCLDPEILSHLRHPGPHVRGCWALDLLLARR